MITAIVEFTLPQPMTLAQARESFVRGKYGTDPVLTFLDCPVVVDNLADEIVS